MSSPSVVVSSSSASSSVARSIASRAGTPPVAEPRRRRVPQQRRQHGDLELVRPLAPARRSGRTAPARASAAGSPSTGACTTPRRCRPRPSRPPGRRPTRRGTPAPPSAGRRPVRSRPCDAAICRAGSDCVSRWIRCERLRRVQLGLAQQARDPPGADVRQEVLPELVRVRVVVDLLVGGRDEPLLGVLRPRQLVERHPAVPLVLRRPPGNRQRPVVAPPPDRVQPGALVADVPVDVGVDEVLPGRLPPTERRSGTTRSRSPAPGRAARTAGRRATTPTHRSAYVSRDPALDRRAGRRSPPCTSRGSARAASRGPASTSGSSRPRTTISSRCTVSGSHAPSYSAAEPSSDSRSR